MTFRTDRFDSKTFSKLFITITVWGVTLMYWLLHNATALYSIGPNFSNELFPRLDFIITASKDGSKSFGQKPVVRKAFGRQ